MKRSRRQKGVGLIEVMVAVLISATGVLGAAALQMNSIKYNQTASTRSTAVFLASDICDRMRANRANALAGNYDIALDADAPKGDAVHQQDLQEWVATLANSLPGGDGSVTRAGTTFTIVVQWNEGRISSTREANSGDNESFVFITEL
ncbi:type IV pilus modification protein PilV [Spongiibacter sp. KMU-158]|uniref:Type IV pilus modification protein PilV n=2 Tax=Spongiibacter pelagi TaxID=2760804 RepID=A0A927GWL5_9GAMM|nr:type IV pilus modification protein PilV [Spongiibacter pelagi]